jgi:hypothetical protein
MLAWPDLLAQASPLRSRQLRAPKDDRTRSSADSAKAKRFPASQLNEQFLGIANG